MQKIHPILTQAKKLYLCFAGSNVDFKSADNSVFLKNCSSYIFAYPDSETPGGICFHSKSHSVIHLWHGAWKEAPSKKELKILFDVFEIYGEDNIRKALISLKQKMNQLLSVNITSLSMKLKATKKARNKLLRMK